LFAKLFKDDPSLKTDVMRGEKSTYFSQMSAKLILIASARATAPAEPKSLPRRLWEVRTQGGRRMVANHLLQRCDGAIDLDSLCQSLDAIISGTIAPKTDKIETRKR
jgi:hypothetical protein